MILETRRGYLNPILQYCKQVDLIPWPDSVQNWFVEQFYPPICPCIAILPSNYSQLYFSLNNTCPAVRYAKQRPQNQRPGCLRQALYLEVHPLGLSNWQYHGPLTGVIKKLFLLSFQWY